jgi:hypothetical protein
MHLSLQTQFGKQQADNALRKKMVKLPFSIFRDFRISGGLCTVFEVASLHANISDWITTDLMNEANVGRAIQLLSHIEKQLVKVLI